MLVIGTEAELLSHVDEYNLYCHYLGYEPEIRLNYTSPLREGDTFPSFGIYPTKKPNREFFWKDSGGWGESGDIFKLVKLLFGYPNCGEALNRIMSDFGLRDVMDNRERLIRQSPIIRSNADIRIIPKAFQPLDLNYWKQFNVSLPILEMYKTSPLYAYWLHPSFKVPSFASNLSYVYRIFDRYQLYFSQRDKGKKFRNDLQDHHVMGVEQLTFKGPLIITKSMKDIQCLRSYGYDAISPRSENVPMPEGFFDWADRHYTNKYVLFDNDMKHKGEWYPYPKVYVPLSSGSKDISDFTRDYSPKEAAQLLQTLIL